MASWDDDLDLEQALQEEEELRGEAVGCVHCRAPSPALWAYLALSAEATVGEKRPIPSAGAVAPRSCGVYQLLESMSDVSRCTEASQKRARMEVQASAVQDEDEDDEELLALFSSQVRHTTAAQQSPVC